MIPELGHYALVLALVMALAQASLPMVGAARGIRPWTAKLRDPGIESGRRSCDRGMDPGTSPG